MPGPSLVKPLRLGIVGLGRTGQFCLERWASRTDIVSVAAWDESTEQRAYAAGLGIESASSLDELLQLEGLDAVLVDVPIRQRKDLAQRVLATGRSLVIEPPVAATLEETADIFAEAERTGSRVVLVRPWRASQEFRSVWEVVHSGQIELLRLLRYEHWEVVAEELAAERFARASPFVAMFDQLVGLVDVPPRSLTAIPLVGGGATITVRFHADLIAVATVHASAATRLSSGWAIDGMRGGYSAGRRWVRAADGEVYHVSVSPAPLVTLEEELFDRESTASWQESLRLAALLQAFEQAKTSGETVLIDRLN